MGKTEDFGWILEVGLWKQISRLGEVLVLSFTPARSGLLLLVSYILT